nr:cadherin-like domain-containing protein [Aliivibrio finisterrensis]
MDIIPQNDAPTGQDFAFDVDEDLSPAELAFTEWNAIFNDIDGDSLGGITITQLASLGDLKLNNITITSVPQQISAAALSNGDFTFTFNNDENGSPYTTFTFTVNDGIANSVEYTATLNILAVDDAPVITVNVPGQAFVENDNAMVVDSNLTIIDVDASNMQSATVTIQGASSAEQLAIPSSSLPNNLTQNYDQATNRLNVSGQGTSDDYQSALRALTYQHTGSALGVNSRDITFTVTDNTGLNSTTKTVNLTLLGFYENIAAFANTNDPNHAIFQTPIHEHYTGVGLQKNTNGYFVDGSNDTSKVNTFLQNEWNNLSINNIATLSAALNAQPDNDKDGQPAYFDDDDTLFHVNSSFVLLPDIDQTLPVVSYDYLFSAKVQIVGQAMREIFFTLDHSGSNYESHIWPKMIADAIEAEFSGEGVNAFDSNNGASSPTVSSTYRNVISGVQWIELSDIEQWQAINAYRVDSNNTVTAPDEADYNMISTTQIESNQLDELNNLLRNNNPLDYATTVELIKSYDIIYEYALATSSPITATKPTKSDYGNIGINQNLDNTNAFNDWLNTAQLVNTVNINAMIEIINFSNGIRIGGVTPVLSQYAEAGITGTSSIAPAQLTDIEKELESSSQETLAEVQAIFNKYNSWQALIDYAKGGGSTPQPSTYSAVGLTNLTSNEISQLNNWLREKTLDTEQKITSAVNIVTYFSGNGASPPSASDYQNIDISQDVSLVLSAVNVLTITTSNTIADLQTLINDIDFDNDGVTFASDSDDTNPWTDYDSDGLNDKMETVLTGFDPLFDNTNTILNDGNGNGIADIWEQMTDVSSSNSNNRNKAIGYFINGELANKASSGPRTISNISTNPVYSENWSSIAGNATYELVAYLNFSNEAGTQYLEDGIFIQSGNMSLRFASEGKKQFAIRSDGADDRNETTQTGSAHFFTATDNQSTLFPSRQYFHLALTFDSASQTFTLYINGSEVGSVQDSSFTALSSANTKIGVHVQAMVSGILTNYMANNVISRNMVTHIQHHDAIWSPQTIQSRADSILIAIEDINQNGIWDTFDLDADSDGLLVTIDDNDNNSFSDKDSDGLNDQFETALSLDSITNDDSNLLTDDNGSRVAVLWDQVKVSPNAMASWINQTWSAESSNLNPRVTLTQPIAGYDNYVYPNRAKTVDLSVLPSDQASYEFIVKITNDNFADLVLLGHHDATDTINATSLTFENSNSNTLGVILNNTGAVNLTNVIDDASPYGDFVHLVYVYEQNADTYTVYVNGQQATTAQSTQLSAIRSPSTPIGLFAKDASGDSNITQLDSMDGIYAFAAYPTALTESDIQTLANTVTTVTLDSDNDGVWDSFDLNKHIPTTADITLNTQEDNNLVFTENDFAFSDQDNADIRTSVTIVSLPDANRGQLFLGSSAVTTNTVINVANIANGELIYQLVADSNNQGEFEFSVSDGQNNSITARMTITITPENDAPVISATTPTLNIDEDTSYIYQPQITDVDNTEAQLTVTLTGPTWLNWDATNQQVIGTPTNADVGDHTINLNVTDGDKSDDIQWLLTVDNTNDAPTGQNESITINEDTSPFTFAASDFTFNDVDTGDSLESIIVTSLPSKGELKSNGSSITSLPSSFTLAQLNNGELTFVFDVDEFGANYSTFEFKLNDGEDDSAASYKFTVNIDNVEDDLSIDIVQVSPILEDDNSVTTPYTFATFSIDDKGENDARNIRLTNNSNSHFVLSGDSLQLTQTGINTINSQQTLDTLTLSVDDSGSGKTIDKNWAVNITNVNDGPTASPRTVALKEDASHVFSIGNFSFSDEESPNLSAIKITQLPANGDLILNNTKITQLDQEVLYNEITNGQLSYQPVADSFSSQVFSYQVSDGQQWSTDTTLTLDIQPVNDEPVALASAITVDEDVPFTISYANFQFNDIEGDALTKVTITQLPNQGQLQLDGNAISAGDEIAVSDINANKLTYQTALNDVNTTSLNFKVFDGTDFSQNIETMTITVTNINDTPVAVNHTINVTEDIEYAFSTAVIDLMFTDDDNSDTMESLIIESIPNNGVIKVNNGSGEISIDNAQLPKSILRGDISQLRYLNNLNNTTQTSFTFSVNDGTTTSANSSTLTINIGPQDDAPIAVDGHIDVIEDTTNSSFSYLIVLSSNTPTATSGQILYRDPDYDDDVNATSLFNFTEISLETLPAHGELSINGASQPLSINDTVSESDITNLIYTPGNNREDNTQFTYKLKSTDKFSQNIATMVINIQAVNDSPDALASSIQVDEDTLSPFTQSHFGYTDLENNAMASVALYQPASGNIYVDTSGNFNGTETIVSSYPVTIVTNDINQYAYKTDQNQDTNDSMLFTVNDGNSDSSQATMTINVNPINDTPTIDANLSITINEDTLYTFQASDITYSDPENDGLDKIKITALPRGELRYNNSLVQVGNEIDFTDIGNLTYQSNLNDDQDTTFEFEIMDDDSSSYSDAATMTIDVQPVNDAPTITLTPIVGGVTENKVSRQTNLLSYQIIDPENDTLTVTIINDPNNWFTLDLVNLSVNPTLAAIAAINDDNQNLTQLTVELEVNDGNLSTNQTATIGITRTADMDNWYSVITFAPIPPVNTVSTVNLAPANSSEIYGPPPASAEYDVNYRYVSNLQPNSSYLNLSLTPDGTSSITVFAEQVSRSNPAIYRTLESDFAFSSDPVNLVRVLTPLLDFDNPLMTTDTVDLLNKDSILTDIGNIEANEPVDITYQWQQHDGTSWQDFGPELSNYQSLSGLQVGNKYRLQIQAQNQNTVATSEKSSDESISVTNATTNYDISFDSLAIPQQGIVQNIRSHLRASTGPAQFSARNVIWQRVNLDNSLTPLTANSDGSYLPTQLDVGLVLRVTVEYLNGNTRLISRTIITSPVEAQANSQELTTLANDLSLSIAPTLLSTGQDVALLDSDIVKITAQNATIQTEYQWQHSADGQTWTPINSNATEVRFVTTTSEDNHYLRLQITMNLISDNTIRLNPLYTNKTEKIQSHTGSKLETLVLDFDSINNTLVLSERSMMWLDNYQKDISATSAPSYQWYRIPMEGSFANNAEAINGATNSNYSLNASSDSNFEHMLVVTVNNNTSLYSTRTSAWLNNSDPTDTTVRERYYDVVTINNGTTPLQDGQIVTALLSGSSLIKDTMPPGLSYQWQSRLTGSTGTWSDIGQDSASYTLSSSESGQDIRVLAARSDASGAVLPQLVSAERNVASTPNPLLPWQISLTQAAEYVVGQPISATHRSTTDNVTYQWHQLSTAADWTTATLISNADEADYILRTDDIGGFIGVVATISDNNGNTLSARQTTPSPIKANNFGSNDSYYLAATLSPSPIYQDSTLSYDLSLYKNSQLVDDPQGNVTSQWYLIDAPEHTNSPSLWQPLSSTTLTSAADGKYVLLKLEYNEANLTTPLELVIVSDDAVQSQTTPNDFETWYSVIEMTPSNPIDKNSRPSLIAANSNENVAESDNSYSVDYHFSPSEAPSKQYNDLISLLGDYPATDSLIVSATQYRGNVSRELSPRSFTFSSDFVYDIRHIIPVLDYNIPLNISDNITLLNQVQVESQVSTLDASISVNYQWQSNDGNGWVDVGAASAAYTNFTSPLTAGVQYRLKLIATDGNISSESVSDVTTEVQNNSISYSIEFDSLAQPQEGIAQSVGARLLSSAPPALFTDRQVIWQRVNADNSLTMLATTANYIPTDKDVNNVLRITIEYHDANGLLIKRSVDTQTVSAKTSSAVLDTLANSLTLTISPITLATHSKVSLLSTTVAAIDNGIAANANLGVNYQWQRSQDGSTWSDNVTADKTSHITTNTDNDHYLRLQITLNDGSAVLNPRFSNQTNKVKTNTATALETLVLDYDPNSTSYHLSERSALWLDKYLLSNSLTIQDYQWYRMPAGGDLINNGEAINAATSDNYALDPSSDVDFEHQLVISLSNNVDVYSERTAKWQNNSLDPTETNQSERYYDVVTINNGTTPLQDGQIVTALLSGSSLIKDTMPPGLSYQWQSRLTGSTGTWSNIGQDSASYTLSNSESGQDIRVLAARSDASGAVLPQLVSTERNVASTPNPLLPWQISLTQAAEYIVGQPISATHRSTTDNVTYQWHQLSTAADWTTATLISNADEADYILRTDDIGGFIGVVATISDNNGNTLSARQTTPSPIKANNFGSNDSYYLAATLSPSPIYQDSTLSYDLSLYKNSQLVDDPQGNVTSQWYLIDAPEHTNSPSLWQPLSSTTLTSAADGKYVLLKLEYNEANLTTPLELVIVSDDAVQSQTTPNDFETWYSVIEMTPSNPIDKNSRPSLIAANSNENVAESDNSYSVDYHFSPSEAPSKQYNDLISLLGDYPATDSLIVSATQYRGNVSRELSPRSFTFSSDFVYDIRHIIPVLDYNIPLNISDNITLLNQVQVESQVSTLDASISVNYQWQSNDGNGWVDVGAASAAYTNFTSPLTAGVQYRLKLIATDGNISSESVSDVTTEVQNNSISYSIEFDSLAQPQEGIRQTLRDKLTSNTPPAQFTDRNIRWQRINNNNTLTDLSDKESFIPSIDEVGNALKITVAYYGAGNLLAQRSIQTQPVAAKSGSSTLDDLANRLTLSISPTTLARQASVSLNANDITAIMNDTSITANYQWQRRNDISNWSAITTNGNTFNYTTVQNDDNHYLRLQLILSTTDNNGNIVQLAPLYSNHTQLIIPNDNEPLETLTLDFDSNANTYTLTDRATMWLNKYQADNNLTLDNYQWYRLPIGGDIANNGEAISGANSYNYQLDSSSDVNFEHQLVVTLDNGISVYSSRTKEWSNNGIDPNKTNVMDRYFDIISITGNATPTYIGQSLTAVFSGSSLQKDIMPPNVKYEWQTSLTGADGSWVPVIGNDSASIIAMNTGYIRVKGICLDDNGVAHKPDRYSDALEVQSGSNPLLPWQINITQSSEYIVGQVITASHRTLTTENVEYEWFRLDSPTAWSMASSSGVKSADHTISDDDVGYYIGIKATISDSINQDVVAFDVTSNPVQKTNSGSNDSYTLTANLTSTPLYQDSALSYIWQLEKNGDIVANPSGTLSTSWYLIDDPSHQSSATLWQPITGNNLANGSAGKYLLLSISYEDSNVLKKPLTLSVVSQEAIKNSTQPSDFILWYSAIKMAPQDPIDSTSVPYLMAKSNSNETQAPDQGNTYTVEYRYSSNTQPSNSLTSLSDLFDLYPDTKSVTVSVKQISQTDSTIWRTFTESFSSTQNPAFLVREIQPVIQFDDPLNMSDTIGLSNPSDVFNEVQALRDNYPVTVKYQWQYFDQSSSNQWQPVGPELDDYNDLMSLTSGYQYRLCLLSENLDTNTSAKVGSNVTSVVQTNSLNFDIEFDNLAEPQVGIKQRIDTRLISSMPPALFTERKVYWDRIGINGLTDLANTDSYTPQPNDEGYSLRITVEYHDDAGLIVKSSIDTKPVSAASGSDTLDDLANTLTLNISPVTLSTQAEVALNITDIAAIDRAIAANNMTAEYQWQYSLDTNIWSNIVDANSARYTTDNTDENRYLRLQLTLTDGNSQLNPLVSNQTEQVKNNTTASLETLTLAFDTTNLSYDLSERATLWLTKYQDDNAISIQGYQWYRIPAGGDLANNGEPINAATNVNYTLDPTSDENFEHQLVVTLDNSVVIYSERTEAWKNNGEDPSEINQVNRFFDSVKIVGGNTPLNSTNTITAELYGSSLQKDQRPTNLSYTWQSRLTGTQGDWSNIGLNNPSYTLANSDQGMDIRVLVDSQDNNGNPLPQLIAPARSVDSSNNPLTPWQVNLTQTSEYIVGQPITASHRDVVLDENVTYQWHRMSTADTSNAVAISNATKADYILSEDDIGYFIAVTATVSDATGAQISAQMSITSPVKASNSNSSDSYYLSATLSPSMLYQDSHLEYDMQLYKNGEIVGAPSGDITAEWYLVSSLSDKDISSNWQAMPNTILTDNAVGKYVLLSINYNEDSLTNPLSLVVLSNTVVSSETTPTTFSEWFSTIDMSPRDPVDTTSTAFLSAKDDQETLAPNLGNSYTVDYTFYSDKAPSDARNNLSDLLISYPNTNSVKVKAKQISQTNSDDTRTFEASFNYNPEPALFIRNIIPHLSFDQPLTPNDTISLSNQAVVVNDVEALMQNYPVSVTYQWQFNDDSGWKNLGSESQSYQDLTSGLTVGHHYRLSIKATNNDNNQIHESLSASTPKVQNSIINYDISIADIAQPQVGLAISLKSSLLSSEPPAMFTERQIIWQRVALNGTVTNLIQGDRYIPSSNDLGSMLRIAVMYYDNDTLIIQRTIDTDIVIIAPQSNTLIDLSNKLSLTLSETTLSTGMLVSLTESDLAQLNAQSLITANYQWQSSVDGESWADIDMANMATYQVSTEDVGKKLRLQLILSEGVDDLSPNYSDSSNAIINNPNTLPTETLAIHFTPEDNSYEISNTSKQWLENYLAQTFSNVSAYQWYRIPVNGSWQSNGIAINSAVASRYTLNEDDTDFTHQLQITLDNGARLFSSITAVWSGNSDQQATDEHANTMDRARYFDTVLIQGGASTATTDQTLNTQLVGSKLSFDLLPPVINYQWQHSSDGISWANISGEINAYYTVQTADQYLRVIVNRQDDFGELTPDLFSNVIQIDATQSPWAISILPYAVQPIIATQLKVAHRSVDNSEKVSYQWYRLPKLGKWALAQPINGANQAQYHITADDLNYYVGVEATLNSDTQTRVARQVLSDFVSPQDNQLDKLKVHIEMPNPIYLDTPLTADITFSQDGELLSSSDYVVSKTWYVLDDPNDIHNSNRWISTDSGVSDKYVLLHLVYQDGDSLVSQYALSEAAVQSDTNKASMESWYSKLVLAPNKPVVRSSRTALISSSPLENNGQESGLFTLELQYLDASDPNRVYSSLQDLVTNVASLGWVQVKAVQTSVIDASIYRVLYSDRYYMSQLLTGEPLPPVVNKNNAPIALDDSVKVEPSTTITLSPLDNDYDTDEGDQITLVSAKSKFGNIAIVDNKIQYTLPTNLPASWYIEYVIADQHGSSNKGLIKLESDSLQTDKPEFEELPSLDLKATGLFNRIEIFSPKATDINGVPIPVSLYDGTLLLRSGSHVIYWQAVDAARNTTQIVSQQVNITPYAEFIPMSTTYEGTTAQIRIKLSGSAPSYPVTIPVIVSTESTSDNNDHSVSLLNTNDVVITSGTEGILEIDIYEDNLNEGEETLHLSFASNVHTGPLSEAVLTISEDKQPITLNANFYNADNNIVSIATPASLSDLNIIINSNVPLDDDNSVIIDWYYSGPNISEESAGQTSNYEPLILPELKETGRYDFTFTAYPLGLEQQPIVGKTSLRIVEEVELSLDMDTDNDGLTDAEEGFADFDNDMIPNYLDPIDDCELQSNAVNTSLSLIFESTPGDCLILGQLSNKIDASSPYINASTLSGIIPDDSTNPNYSSENVFNFTVRNQNSQSSIVVIPLLEPLSSGSILRKYTDQEGWFDFDESEDGSNLKYARGELGNCPPPHSSLYQEEIVVGGYCIEMTIKDGGRHDGDNNHDDNIDDPSYVYSSIPSLNIDPFDYVITYNPDNIPLNFSVDIDLCDYIAVTDCESLQVVSITSKYVTTNITANSGTRIDLQIPSWYRSAQALTFTVQLDGAVGTVDMNINYSAEISATQPESSGASGGSITIYSILLLMLLCIRLISPRIRIRIRIRFSR